MTATATAPTRDPLTSARAAKELADLRLLREVARARSAGRSQAAIADKLGVSQPAVHKMLVRIRHKPDLFTVTPFEVALRYAAGEVAREELLATYAAWPWTYDRFLDADNPEPEQFVRGDWSDLELATLEGFLTDEDYDTVTSHAV